MTAPRGLHLRMLLCACLAVVASAVTAQAQVPGRPANPPSEPSAQAEVRPISIPVCPWTLVTEVEEDLWVCCFGACFRVDTGTSPAGLIPLRPKIANPFVLGFGFGSVWVCKGRFFKRTPVADQGLYRLDPKTNEEVAKIPVGDVRGTIFIADGSVWASDVDLLHLYRVDPKTNQVTAKVSLKKNKKSKVAAGFLGPYVAAAMGSVWVLYTDGTLSRIDPETNQILAEIRVGPPHRMRYFSNDTYSGLAIGEGSAWITESKEKGNLIRVDLKTNQVVATIPVGYQPQSPVVGGGFVWVSTYYTNSAGHFVVKIDPRTNQVLGRMLLRGTQPYLSAQEDGILAWGEELKVWGSPKHTYIWKIAY